jgi:uncharacterized protein (TIGR00369 family)
MEAVDARAHEIWRETVRGGYPDPSLFALPGIEQVRGFLDGRAPRPPISHLIGMRPTGVGPGTSVFTMPATGWLSSPLGVMLGGVHAVLGDGPLGCALQSLLPPLTPYTTADLSVTFLRPAGVRSGRLAARGRVIHAGRRSALTEVLIEDSDGLLLAHGTSRLAILPQLDAPPPAAPPRPAADAGPDPYERPSPDTFVPQEVWERMTGLEVMRAFLTDEVPRPPISHLTGLRPVEASEGTCTFVLPATEWLCSPIPRIEGGVLAMLCDAAIASAVQTTLPPATAYASVDLKVTYFRPAFPDGRDLVARADVIHRGSSLATAGCTVRNADGKTVVSGVGSVMILPGRSPSLDRPVIVDEELGG